MLETVQNLVINIENCTKIEICFMKEEGSNPKLTKMF